MIRHIGLLLLLSFLLLFFMPSLHWLAIKLYQFDLFLAYKARDLFSDGVIGHIVAQALTLTLTPLIFAAIPAGLYWTGCRRTLPCTGFIIWALWLMLVMILACHK